MIRVNHAGEHGAARIYAGQLHVMERQKKRDDGKSVNVNGEDVDEENRRAAQVVKHMYEQEVEHRREFDRLLAERRVRPTLFAPMWDAAAFGLGVSTALLSKEAVMLCTVAVEDAITEHYDDQLRTLIESESKDEHLKSVIAKFRDEEMQHRDIGIAHGADRISPSLLHAPLYYSIHAASKLAVFLSTRL